MWRLIEYQCVSRSFLYKLKMTRYQKKFKKIKFIIHLHILKSLSFYQFRIQRLGLFEAQPAYYILTFKVLPCCFFLCRSNYKIVCSACDPFSWWCLGLNRQSLGPNIIIKCRAVTAMLHLALGTTNTMHFFKMLWLIKMVSKVCLTCHCVSACVIHGKVVNCTELS